MYGDEGMGVRASDNQYDDQLIGGGSSYSMPMGGGMQHMGGMISNMMRGGMPSHFQHNYEEDSEMNADDEEFQSVIAQSRSGVQSMPYNAGPTTRS